jgi:hypothetical protein
MPGSLASLRRCAVQVLLASGLAALAVAPAWSAPEGGRERHDNHAAPGGRVESRWYDGAHGHGRYYPTPGWRVRTLPAHPHTVIWAGVNYAFWDGVWYSPGAGGYVVVRPPYGVVVTGLPAFRTLVTIGGLSYFYLNGVYYRQQAEDRYEVVPTPVASGGSPSGGGSPSKVFVYPRQGQTAERQSSDEYECHRWAVGQAGFDPSSVAVGQSADVDKRGDYQRAQAACLEGRGYTVR